MSFPNNQSMAAGAVPVWFSGAPPAGGGPTPKGYQQIALGSGVETLTVPVGATLAIVNVEGADARYTDDGSTPSASVGMNIYNKTTTPLPNPAALKFFRQAAGAILNVSYYGP